MLKRITFKRLHYKTFTVDFITNLPLHGLLKTLGLKHFSGLFWYTYISSQLDIVPVVVHIVFRLTFVLIRFRSREVQFCNH